MKDMRNALWLTALSFLMAPLAYAGSVVPMPVSTLADHAGQVIIGEISGVRSYLTGDGRGMESEVIFRNVEYVKGRRPGSTSTFSLVVPGGKVGDREMSLGCAPRLGIGEKWMLFLLPSYKTHPVVGLWQGAFRLRAGEDGVERVFDARGVGVSGIDERGFVRAQTDRTRPIAQVAASRHVRIKNDGGRFSAEAAPLRASEFVELLRPVLAASRSHPLTQPAGRRELVQYTPLGAGTLTTIEDKPPAAENEPAQSVPKLRGPLPTRVAPASRSTSSP